MSDLKDFHQAIDRLADNDKINERDELLETATVLARLSAVKPDESRRDELKERFLAYGRELVESRATRQVAPIPRRWSFTRRIAVVVMALLIPSGGVVYAASGSMPDSPLYPIKRATESVSLSVASGISRTRLETALAQKRVREARYLLEQTGNAANRSQAIKLLIEARADGDRGLKNRVDELLKQVGAENKAKNDKTGETKTNQEKSKIRPEVPKPQSVDDRPGQATNPKETGKTGPNANSKANPKANSDQGRP